MTTAALRRTLLPLLALLALVAALTLRTTPAAASSGCTNGNSSNVFSAFGDTNAYYLLQGGSFESSTTSWSGGNRVAGNEPYFLAGSGHTKSLSLSAGTSASSGWVCLGKTDPTIRFLAKSAASGSGGNYTSLNVSVTLKGETGSQVSIYLGQLQAGSFAGWKVTPIFSYAAWLNQPWLYAGGTNVRAMFTFTVGGSGGTWNIDDTFIDPFKGI